MSPKWTIFLKSRLTDHCASDKSTKYIKYDLKTVKIHSKHHNSGVPGPKIQATCYKIQERTTASNFVSLSYLLTLHLPKKTHWQQFSS